MSIAQSQIPPPGLTGSGSTGFKSQPFKLAERVLIGRRAVLEMLTYCVYAPLSVRWTSPAEHALAAFKDRVHSLLKKNALGHPVENGCHSRD